MGSQVTTRPVLERDLDALSGLFGAQWSTRHCWCMAFCSTGRQFSFGWFGGGNARRFAAMAARSPNPMGILAFREVSAGEEVVGWCACGPRSRYAGAATTRTAMIRDFAQQEHATVWFVPCFFVRAGFRGQGVTGALLGAAVELARGQGAMAIEGWPIAGISVRGRRPWGARELSRMRVSPVSPPRPREESSCV
ncbi:MAG TPA: GNAT family N-acetyltransferase [Nakamurella sp.]